MTMYDMYGYCGDYYPPESGEPDLPDWLHEAIIQHCPRVTIPLAISVPLCFDRLDRALVGMMRTDSRWN